MSPLMQHTHTPARIINAELCFYNVICYDQGIDHFINLMQTCKSGGQGGGSISRKVDTTRDLSAVNSSNEVSPHSGY